VLKVSVISPEKVLYEGDASSVVAPAFDGELGILSGHAPMITALGTGTLRVDGGAGNQRFSVEGGFLKEEDDQVRVVTEQATSL